MAASKLRFTSFKLLRNYRFSNAKTPSHKLFYCTTKTESEAEPVDKKWGFAEFTDKKPEFLETPKTNTEHETFASLLRNSEFVNLGDPVGKEVIGTIYHVVENDLYIDFGWKFPAVCRQPEHNKKYYVPGARVKLLIKDLELSTKFLGGDGYVSLLEADCLLLGLARKPPPETGKPTRDDTLKYKRNYSIRAVKERSRNGNLAKSFKLTQAGLGEAIGRLEKSFSEIKESDLFGRDFHFRD